MKKIALVGCGRIMARHVEAIAANPEPPSFENTVAALETAEEPITCNAICPGNIITPMTTGTDPAVLDPDMIGAMAAHSNLKTPSCTAEDVANVILFFASDESRAITGQVIVTDFGAML